MPASFQGFLMVSPLYQMRDSSDTTPATMYPFNSPKEAMRWGPQGFKWKGIAPPGGETAKCSPGILCHSCWEAERWFRHANAWQFTLMFLEQSTSGMSVHSQEKTCNKWGTASLPSLLSFFLLQKCYSRWAISLNKSLQMTEEHLVSQAQIPQKMDVSNATQLKPRDAMARAFSWHHSRKHKEEKEVSYNYKIYFTACYVFSAKLSCFMCWQEVC